VPRSHRLSFNLQGKNDKSIVTGLQVNNTLKVMNLRFNEIADSGATAIGAALKLNTSVQELDLGGNL
jgi:hypothetical protein